MVDRILRRAVYFTAPREVVIQDEELSHPGPGQVLVKSLLTGVSSGTEMLIYRGQFPANISLDASLPDLAGAFRYPLKYGYSSVGRVVEAGPEVDPTWTGKLVFAFHSHESHFISTPQDLHHLPAGMDVEEAVFLPNVETAVNFLLDSRPMIGEKVAVFGQGIVGLLTTALLRRFPLSCLVTLDRYPLRREAAIELGASRSYDPAQPGLRPVLQGIFPKGADLVFELTGLPEVLDQAIEIASYTGRIVVGSWYGEKRAKINFGGRYHRERIRLISSQVSSLDPELSGRWDKARRLQVAWEALASIRPSRFITHRFAMEEAARAYQLLDQEPQNALQVVLQYPD